MGLALHPAARRRYGDEILAAASLPDERVFDAARLREPDVQRAIVALGADIGLSVLLGYILAPTFLSSFPQGVVNLHPALLPWNRGADPNVWSIVERTPAGATLHWMDAGVDTGDIIAQATTEIAADGHGRDALPKARARRARPVPADVARHRTGPGSASASSGRRVEPPHA